jgi:transposase
MHGRRYFTKALDGGDARAALPLAAYKTLYEIEGEARELPEEERLAIRQARSRPVWAELCAWCETYKPHEPPSSKLGEAIRYFTNNQEALGRSLENGAIPVDNGIVERLHARAALSGRITSSPDRMPAVSAPRSPIQSSAPAASLESTRRRT